MPFNNSPSLPSTLTPSTYLALFLGTLPVLVLAEVLEGADFRGQKELLVVPEQLRRSFGQPSPPFHHVALDAFPEKARPIRIRVGYTFMDVHLYAYLCLRTYVFMYMYMHSYLHLSLYTYVIMYMYAQLRRPHVPVRGEEMHEVCGTEGCVDHRLQGRRRALLPRSEREIRCGRERRRR